MTYERGKLYEVPVIDFKNDPNQPRKYMDPQGLEELAASIRTHGILEPVLFRSGDQGWVIIVAGERRLAAAKMAGLHVIPGICVEGNHAEIALVENLLRQDLTAVEEAEALKRLMDEQNYTQEQLAGVIGKPRTTINEMLLINRLPPEIRDECRGNTDIPKSDLVEISRKKQERGMRSAFEKLKERLQKEREGKRPREVKTPAGVLCALLEKTRERLDKAEIADWSDADLAALNDAVAGLREALDAFENPSEDPGAAGPIRELS
ncbi:MAG TPA: ParB/RepB/Spo0J family partition protein [Syntrophales bacterium]|nr:ParB/RepB/Spo0J family partition protein [Syntrophales bacterium]HOD99146.1 ParB/RepB/Spo0J family partition protein [Syntrophales bacterium]HOH71998.1 ParB/RepB/Spo0J family partition protein [Syntrophales bacterium]HPN07823.1 ParB/RepB/Spo0J family partition protein [Syntrophales bacterium]HQK78107.1 ParB/RepB/Spo0J family partition protein [Syntrophales bacterium]